MFHESRVAYPLRFQLGGIERWLIWLEGEHSSWEDGVHVEVSGRVFAFSTFLTLSKHLQLLRIEMGEMGSLDETHFVDLDEIERWLMSPILGEIDCMEFLGAWNLFRDVSQSVQLAFEPDMRDSARVNDKLFRGNNLSAVTPPGDHFVPIWDENEKLQVAEILSKGLEIFKSAIEFVD